MEKDQLKELENQSRELLDLLKESRDIENGALDLPPVESIMLHGGKTVPMRRVSTWWVAAALVAGIIIGNLTTHSTMSVIGNGYSSTHYADTCRSLADGDVNLALLITHL